MIFESAFIASAANEEQFPKLSLPEIAFVGRSNVGKSSLINHFTQKNQLAHVSSSPGKTQLINFFSWGQTATLVDLPGYGFAKVSKTLREKWGDLIQKYLESRKNLTLILLLVDLRHPPTKDDLAFATWAAHFQKPLLIVFTKADKLSPSKQTLQAEENATLLEEATRTSISYLLYSIKNAKGRLALTKKIKEMLS